MKKPRLGTSRVTGKLEHGIQGWETKTG